MAVYLPLEKVENIRVQMERSKPVCKYWWVQDTDGTLIAENESDAGTLDDCYNELVSVLNDLTGDYVFVTIRNKIPNKDDAGAYKRGANIKGIQKFEYRVKIKPDAIQTGRPINGIGAGDPGIFGLYSQIGDLKAQLVETRMSAQIAGLEAKLNEKPVRDSSNTDKLIDGIAKRVVDYFAGEINLMPKAEGPVSGAGKEEKKEVPVREPLTEEQQKAAAANLGNDLKTVAGVMGPEFYDLVAAMKKQAEQNPEGFKMYAGQIINSAK